MKFTELNKLQYAADKPKQSYWYLFSAIMLLLFINLPSQAAYNNTFYVNSGSDGVDANAGNGHCQTSSGLCTLRAAIQEANALSGADEIIIQDGLSITLTLSGINDNSAASGDLDITDDILIRGGGASHSVISAAGLGDRAFHVLKNNKTVTLKNITITGANIINTNGAGILIQGSGTIVTIENASIISNTISLADTATVLPGFSESGGGIYVDSDAQLVIRDTTISNNIAPHGAGITNLGRIEVRNSTINNNFAKYNFDGANIGVHPVTGIDYTAAGVLTLHGYGGGIMNLGGYLNIANSTLKSNTAGQAGGIYHTNAGLNVGNTIITNSTFDSNSALLDDTFVGGFGGGIFNTASMTVNNTTVSNNYAASDGGGLANSGSANIDITNSTISTNRARSGGGIYNTRDVTLTNVTIYNNRAYPQTAGSDGCVASTQCTLGGDEIAIYDTDTSGTGSDPSVTVVNTIIANELGTSQDVCTGLAGFTAFVTSIGNNLESTNTCGLNHLNDTVNSAAIRLGPLTLEIDTDTAVHPLLAGSDAINRGNDSACPAVDQRFKLRSQKDNGDSLGACDIGAYEYGADKSVKNTYVDLKLTLSDSPDPVAPNDSQELLTYSVIVTNLYADVAAQNIEIAIDLPASVNFVNLSKTSTDSTPACDSAPNVNNRIICEVAHLSGLGRVEIFVTVMPTLEGFITASAEISNTADLNPPDAFTKNNSATEETEVTTIGTGGSGTNNFGGLPPGGGGAVNPLMLFIAGLLLIRRRLLQATRS